MDKNTILGLLLMGAVIFGFTWLNAPDESQVSKSNEEVAKEKSSEMSLVGDSISAKEWSNIVAVVKQYGKQTDNGEVALANENVNLTVAGDVLKGSVACGDTVFTVDDLKKAAAPDSRLITNAALANLRTAVSSFTKYSNFVKFVSGDSTTVKLKNNLLDIDIATKGGMISRVELLNYTAYSNGKNGPAVLFENNNNSYSFVLNTHTQRYDTKDFYFTPIVENDSTVLMKLEFEKSVSFGIRYTLPNDSYKVRMEVVQQNMDAIIPTNIANMDFQWSQMVQRHERGEMFEERNSALYYKYLGGDTDYLSETGSDNEDVEDKLKWVAFKDQFFSCVLIADSYFLGTNELSSKVIDKESPLHKNYMKDLSVSSQLDYSSSNPKPAAFTFFFGPNEYKLLDKYSEVANDEDLELTRLIPLGWSMFRWINTIIIIPIFNFLGTLDLNYGIIILILTFFIKLVLFPLSLIHI